ncbi:hypothetical protein ACU4GG_02370 [Streptomyces nojiriensis]
MNTLSTITAVISGPDQDQERGDRDPDQAEAAQAERHGERQQGQRDDDPVPDAPVRAVRQQGSESADEESRRYDHADRCGARSLIGKGLLREDDVRRQSRVHQARDHDERHERRRHAPEHRPPWRGVAVLLLGPLPLVHRVRAADLGHP